MDTVNVVFQVGGKTVTLRREVGSKSSVTTTVRRLLEDVRQIENPTTASRAQLRALYARAAAAGWEKERIKSFLEKNLGSSSGEEIVGQVAKEKISRLIDSIGPSPDAAGKATAAQLKTLWGKALKKGWERERIRAVLKEKLGSGRDSGIIGRIDRDKVAAVIDSIEAA